MKVPLSWLRDFVDTDLTADELARVLTGGGLEVSGVTELGADWAPDKILVGEVLEVQQHPNADRLTVPIVSYGEGRTVQVVTGAPNITVGMRGAKVALALEGARYIDGHSEGRKLKTLKPGKLRGVDSQGMVMSELELGISDEHEGILLLPDDAPVGTPLRDYLGDAVLEIDITPNMARALSILGVAREVAALTGARFSMPAIALEEEGERLAGRASVEILAQAACYRFTLGLAEGITIGPSPAWMQRRLKLAGMRPINNIVDISNYVMLELGQPNHMFDADAVVDKHLIVREARPGERLVTLDNKERELGPQHIVVADPSGAISLAGVMGGATTEVREGTLNVLIEAANWNMVAIRRTAREFKLASEASRRFERGVDIELTSLAVRRCAQLIREYAGGTIAQGLVDVYPRPYEPLTLRLTPAEVRRIVGIELDAATIARLLASLGFGCALVEDEGAGGAAVQVVVPSFRFDVEGTADLCEEVARVYGYDKIPSLQLDDQLPEQVTHEPLVLEQKVRDLLAGAGLDEAITYSLTNMEAVALVDPGAADPSRYLKLANPITPERVYMRQSLLPTLLDALALSLRERERVALFEIGRVYLPRAGEVLPEEPRRLAIAMGGLRASTSWLDADPTPLDFFDLKGVVEVLLARLGLAGQARFVALGDDPRLHPGRAARLELLAADGNSTAVGVLGELHPELRARLELGAPRVGVAEFDLDALIAAAQPASYTAISRYPVTVQDLSIVASTSVAADQIERTIRAAAGELLERVQLFDVYTGPQLGEGKRSLTYSLSFRAADRTLSDKDVTRVRGRVVSALERELGATIRS
jgi:phenylalanyl-tRNA synthetase beta chain